MSTPIHKVPFHGPLRIGGYVYQRKAGKTQDVHLRHASSDGLTYHPTGSLIVDTQLPVSRFHQVAWHEILHAINRVYCNDSLSERDIEQVSHGLLQVAEQMGIRIVP